MAEKIVVNLHPAERDDIGDLVTRRPLPGRGLDQLDPFLFLNHHGPQLYPPGNHGLPFGPHPHRGFETVTFIVDGALTHRDSAGHASVIGAGGVQWMRAGRGIVHAELSPPEFMRDGGPLELLQLWLNLPGRLKMSEPAYTGLQREDIPAIDTGGSTVHLIAGHWHGYTGPVLPIREVFMATLELRPGATLYFDALAGRNVLLYVVRGAIQLGGADAPQHTLVELDTAGDALTLHSAAGALLAFGHARPIGEPVVAHGPFVMNTREEIAAAITDYQSGRFGVPS